MEIYRSNNDNNNFNYDDIDKEILQFEYHDSIGEFETIVFRDYDDILNATLQEEGSTELEWTLKKYRVDNDKIDNTELDDNATVFRLVSDNVDTCQYYFVNSNNGEIPEDELNYQTSIVDSKDMASTLEWKKQARISSHDGLNYRRSKTDSNEITSTMKWKILVRQLG